MKDDGISLTELDALEFFGAEPTSRAYGDRWYDSDSVYEASDAFGMHLTCAIHPIHRDVRIRLLLADALVYEWQTQDLADIAYAKEDKKETLRFVVSERDVLTLQISPRISIDRRTIG